MKTEEYKELDVLMSSEVINTKGEDNKFKLPPLPYKENALEPVSYTHLDQLLLLHRDDVRQRTSKHLRFQLIL